MVGLNQLENVQSRISYCSDCDLSILSTIHHLLFECTHYERKRHEEWSKVESVIPIALLNEINIMDNEEKAVFILKGLDKVYVREFKETYDVLLDFVYNMYKEKINNAY